MFAVKGWAVDATSLKPQLEPFKAPSTSQEDVNKQSKKRKREDGSSFDNADVGKLWDRHIEGKKAPESKKEEKKERKRQKLEQAQQAKSAQRDHKRQDGPKLGSSNVGKDVNVSRDDAVRKTSKKDKKAKKEAAQREEIKSTKPKDNGTSRAGSDHTLKQPLPPIAKLTPMQAAMRQKLVSARFRHLNQTLYTEPSAKAFELFGQNPDMFEDYHAGFRQQVSVWPENPVDTFTATIRARGKLRLPSQKKAFKDKKKQSDLTQVADSNGRSITPLPRTQGTCILADLGCGDARLAQTLKDSGETQKLNLKILSYDLHSPSPLVTKADISNIPSPDGSVDIAIFCLALMGTNWISFIEEAYRILHWKGELWVAEIKSRFGRVGRAGKPVEHSVGGKRKQAALKKAQEAKLREQEDVNEQQTLAVEVDGVETKNEETDVSAFVDVLRRRGFLLKNGESSIDLSNKMFVKMEFVKAAAPTKGKGVPNEGSQTLAKFKAKTKFLDEKADDVATDDEAKVLKPCLYKIR